VTNIAWGHGYFGDELIDSNLDDETVTGQQMPALTIVKSATPAVILSGETVTYTYVVTNTGNVTLTDVTVTDDILGAIGSIESLAPGGSVTFTVTTEVIGDVTNIGTAVGEAPDETSVTDNDDAVVDVVNPQIEVTKTPATTEILVGETVIYTYVVTNVGDVDLYDVVLTDDKLGVVGTLEYLAVGESEEFTASAVLNEPTTNVVMAVGVDEFQHEVSDEATAFVDVGLPFSPPDLTIDKTADKTEAVAGDSVVYTLTYENLGPGVASDITIVDDFDERYVTVTDAGGGTVADGKITWNISGPLYAEDGAQKISYTVKIDPDLSESVKIIRNTVVISEPTEVNTDNNTDTWEVDVEAPFLPFTGGQVLLMALITGFAVLVGAGLRRYGQAAPAEL
jgi:uncharacterized repeat protein (TIGR01451 family)